MFCASEHNDFPLHIVNDLSYSYSSMSRDFSPFAVSVPNLSLIPEDNSEKCQKLTCRRRHTVEKCVVKF